MKIATVIQGSKGVRVNYVTNIPGVTAPFTSDSVTTSSVGRVRLQNPTDSGVVIHYNDSGGDAYLNLEDINGVQQTVDFVYLDGTTATASTNVELRDNFEKILGIT